MDRIFDEMEGAFDHPCFTISAAAAATSLHQQTIRAYENRGLITPFRTPGGTRMYSYKDIMRLKMISSLSQDGVSLEGILRILEMQDEMSRMSEKMENMFKENLVLRSALKTARRRKRLTGPIACLPPIE